MSEGELKKRVRINQQVTKADIKKTLESAIINGLANSAHLTGQSITQTEILVRDLFYSIFEKPSTKWAVQAYVSENINQILDEAKKEFPMPAIRFLVFEDWLKKWFGE